VLAEACLLTSKTAISPRYSNDFLLPHRDKNVIAGQAIAYVGPVARYRRLLAFVLARDDLAQRDFEHALTRARALEAAPWVARTRDRVRALPAPPGRRR
jgi:hypothetical protein